MVEAVCISGLGGALGFGLGYIASFVIGMVMQTDTEVPGDTVLLTFARFRQRCVWLFARE